MEAEADNYYPPAPPFPLRPKERKKLPRPPSPARPRDMSGWTLAKLRSSDSNTPGSPVSLSSQIGLVGRRTRQATKNHPDKSRNEPDRSGLVFQEDEARVVDSRPVSAKGPCLLADVNSEEGPINEHEKNKFSGEGTCRQDSNPRWKDEESQGQEGKRGPSHRPEEDKRGLNVLELPDATDEDISPLDEHSLDSRLELNTSLTFSDLTEELMNSTQEGLLRELDELHSENDYLKDEIEELRSEMLEMRDAYTEEDVYQLQELQMQLDHANKTCRILQYRLRKAERRSLRVAQTGHVDGELIHSLEQDVKVAKDVSVRLHNELEAVEKKKVKLEEENEDLRQRLIETEVAKQVLLNEMDKFKENSLKKRGGRPSGKAERKSSLQEDSADLKCQLRFAKEETALMCRKLTKLAKDTDIMREELLKYNSLYGDLDSTLSVEELVDTPYSREAELKVHLKLVEEEANILSRRIVELEVENRGIRAEMDEMKGQGDKDLIGPDVLLSFSCTNYGESGEKCLELRKHLQFVEEEAEVLRRSLMESEDQNKLLMNELNKYKSERDQDRTISEDSGSVISEPSQEELSTAKIQISELSGKVKKLQYENRVLLTNLQRYDLASSKATQPVLETSAEAGDSAQCIPTTVCRKVPATGENGTEGCQEKKSRSMTIKCQDISHTSPSKLFTTKDLENLLSVRDQATLVNNTIEVLIAEQNDINRRIDNEYADLLLTDKVDNEMTNNSNMINVLFAQLGLLQKELNYFMRRMENGLKINADSLNVHPASLSPSSLKEYSSKEEGMSFQIKEPKTVLSEANGSIQGLQEQLSQERQLRKEEPESFNQKLVQLNEDHQKALLRRDFELESLNLQRRLEQKFWSQEKNFLVQESQQFKQTFLLLFMKLKWFLKGWRSGKILPNEGDDFLEVW